MAQGNRLVDQPSTLVEQCIERCRTIGLPAIGAIAGWLAGTLVKGGGFGLLGNIIVGIVGAFVGGYLFGAPAVYLAR